MSDKNVPPCVLRPDAEFHGFFELASPGRIDGHVEGEIVSSDRVWIGASARVKARITAPEIVIAGEVEGEVTASCRIELLSSARVTAALDTPRLVLAEGSFLEGRCRTDPRPPSENSDFASNQSLSPS
jgi:cytoskeletal protein CcmA (bactofilin family)